MAGQVGDFSVFMEDISSPNGGTGNAAFTVNFQGNGPGGGGAPTDAEMLDIVQRIQESDWMVRLFPELSPEDFSISISTILTRAVYPAP